MQIKFFSFRATYVAILLIVYACGGTEATVRIYTDEQIAIILADCSAADAAVNPLSGYGRDSVSQEFYKQIFEKNDITLEVYEANLDLLAKDIPRMERVIKRATQIMEDKKKMLKPESATKDSIRSTVK